MLIATRHGLAQALRSIAGGVGRDVFQEQVNLLAIPGPGGIPQLLTPRLGGCCRRGGCGGWHRSRHHGTGGRWRSLNQACERGRAHATGRNCRNGGTAAGRASNWTGHEEVSDEHGVSVLYFATVRAVHIENPSRFPENFQFLVPLIPPVA